MNQVKKEPDWIGKNLIRIVLFFIVVLAIFGWKLYASFNDDGLITGVVVNQNGDPVAGATVQIQEKTINLLKPPIIAITGRDGRFEYSDMAIIEFVVTAIGEGYRVSEPNRYHLYFQRQNYELPQPIVLRPLEPSSE